MFARRTLMQLATKLAIGLGALFLVGVLLAAIPNHRAPVVTSVSAEPGQEAQGMDHASLLGKVIERTKSNEKDAVRNMAQIQHRDRTHKHVTAPRASDSTQ